MIGEVIELRNIFVLERHVRTNAAEADEALFPIVDRFSGDRPPARFRSNLDRNTDALEGPSITDCGHDLPRGIVRVILRRTHKLLEVTRREVVPIHLRDFGESEGRRLDQPPRRRFPKGQSLEFCSKIIQEKPAHFSLAVELDLSYGPKADELRNLEDRRKNEARIDREQDRDDQIERFVRS